MTRKSPTKSGDIRRWLAWVLQQETDDCILWPFRVEDNGYGRVRIYDDSARGYKNWTSHRWICWAAHGEPPTPKHQAAHGCGVRRCSNKRHLRWATCRANLADRLAHGTLRFGKANHATTHSVEHVTALREAFYSACDAWAAEFGMDVSTVRKIVRGQSRKYEGTQP